jgi:hypothetical protein
MTVGPDPIVVAVAKTRAIPLQCSWALRRTLSAHTALEEA